MSGRLSMSEVVPVLMQQRVVGQHLSGRRLLVHVAIYHALDCKALPMGHGGVPRAPETNHQPCAQPFNHRTTRGEN